MGRRGLKGMGRGLAMMWCFGGFRSFCSGAFRPHVNSLDGVGYVGFRKPRDGGYADVMKMGRGLLW